MTYLNKEVDVILYNVFKTRCGHPGMYCSCRLLKQDAMIKNPKAPAICEVDMWGLRARVKYERASEGTVRRENDRRRPCERPGYAESERDIDVMWGNKSDSRSTERERKRLVMQSKIECVRIAFELRRQRRAAREVLQSPGTTKGKPSL